MTRRDAIGGFTLAGVAALSGCGMPSPARYRFRLTVEVDTPQGLRAGSSVLEVSSSLASWRIGDSSALATGLKGEAVVIDVMPGQTLFALIGDVASGDGLAGVVTLLFEPNYTGPESFVASVGKLGRADQRGRTAALPRDKFPLLVRFRNIADPRTIKRVVPEELVDDFGPGIVLKRISVQITDEPITTRIEKRLVWLPNVYSMGLGPEFKPDGIPVGDFKRLFGTELDR